MPEEVTPLEGLLPGPLASRMERFIQLQGKAQGYHGEEITATAMEATAKHQKEKRRTRSQMPFQHLITKSNTNQLS